MAAAGVAAAVFVASTDSGGRGHPRPPAASPAPGGPQVIISPPGQGGSGSGPQTAANLAPAGFIGPQVSFAGTKAWLIANVSLYVSGNGGRTWQLKLRGDGPLGEPLNVGFWSSAGGWVSTQSADGAQQMYLTGDQGAHWRRIALPFGTVWAQFADGRHGWALDGRATLFRTTDGGRTWEGAPTPGTLNTACAQGPDTVVGVIDGRQAEVVQTTDGGARWDRVYRLPGPVVSGSPAAVCSASSPTAVVAFARSGASESNVEAFAAGEDGAWRWLGAEPGQQGLGVATGPGGSVVAAYQAAGSLVVYRSDGRSPMRLSARLPIPGEPPGGTAQAGLGQDGQGLVALTCGTTVYTGVTGDGGATWSSRVGRLSDPGENTDPSC